MNDFVDAIHLFTRIVKGLKTQTLSLHSSLEELVIQNCGRDLAYVDNRNDAKNKYRFDFWDGFSLERLKDQGIAKKILYSESQQFPDFIFKGQRKKGKIFGGAILELKDSKSASIASFNSTIPTKYKSLEEVDVINGNHLVSRIAKVKDKEIASDELHSEYQRRCFYLVRTHKKSDEVKVSIVDGSFFETVPKEHLFYQMFLNVLQQHLQKKDIDIPQEKLNAVEEALSYITDQTIIAGSQVIAKASVRPRLRIMAEVHPEGNPHSSHYPQITKRSFNMILQSTPETRELQERLVTDFPEIESFSIKHKRNGEHIVFQFAEGERLTRYLE